MYWGVLAILKNRVLIASKVGELRLGCGHRKNSQPTFGPWLLLKQGNQRVNCLCNWCLSRRKTKGQELSRESLT